MRQPDHPARAPEDERESVSAAIEPDGYRAARLAPFALVALFIAQAAGGCVCEDGRRPTQGLPGDNPKDPKIDPSAPPAARELMVWQFPLHSEPALVSLWPADAVAPQRKKRGLDTKREGDLLVAKSLDKDPWFLWQFETPLPAALVRLDVESDRTGILQLFWSTIDCPTFREECSAIRPIGPGRQPVEYLLGFGHATRELRLDPVGEEGARLVVHDIRLFRKAELTSMPERLAEHTRIESTANGLVVTADERDPWLTLKSTGLFAQQASDIEIELVATAGARPQIFWAGEACPYFQERCSVTLEPKGGAGSFAAHLDNHPSWTGRVSDLRLDPDDAPGRYLVKRIALIRKP